MLKIKNFANWVTMLIPVTLLQPLFVAWIKVITYPFNVIYNMLLYYIATDLTVVYYNGQRILLESLLNTTFNTTLIYIDDAASNIIYLNNRNELYETIWLGTLMLMNNAEQDPNAVDFSVYVPASIYADNNNLLKIQSLINLFKLANKKFNIKQI